MGARIVAGTGGILLNVMIIKMVADWFPSKEAAMAIIGNSAPAGIALALATIPWIASSGDRVPASISVGVYLALAFVALAAAIAIAHLPNLLSLDRALRRLCKAWVSI